MTKKQLFILRHGETDYNRLGIIQGGGVDSSLNDTGRKQAKAFFDAYQAYPFEVVVTSALQRTHQTVQHFIEQGLPWIQRPDINEMNWGVHEGKTSTPELEEDYQWITSQWRQGKYEVPFEGGESASVLGERVSGFVEWLVQQPETHILVCSHGRTMRCLMCLLHGAPLSEMDTHKHANTGLYHFEYQEGQFTPIRVNDTSHLAVQSATPITLL